MSLASLQRSFMGHVLAEDAPLPAGWRDGRQQEGLAIYRNGYRSRMVGALGEVLPRTRQWCGTESFQRAAAHHLILQPPSHWSLDRAGDGFPNTLAELFPNHPEIPELAWLEWDMHMAFVAADMAAIDIAGFAAATAHFEEEDWAQLRLKLSPTFVVRTVHSRAGSIWRALMEESEPPADVLMQEPARLLVWREETRPVFRAAAAVEGRCLNRIRDGASFGDICHWLARDRSDAEAASEAGAMLGRWVREGLIVGLD